VVDFFFKEAKKEKEKIIHEERMFLVRRSWEYHEHQEEKYESKSQHWRRLQVKRINLHIDSPL
jgi:hypothetical protein